MAAWLGAATLIIAAAASGVVTVKPTGTSEIAPDGRINAIEWSDATRIPMGENVVILIKANDEEIAIAVKSAARGPSYTDLYLTASDGQVWNLHAEQQTAERKLEGTAWTEADPAFVPYNNASWRANVVEFKPNADSAAPLAKQVKAYDGQEFFITRSGFAGKQWRLRVELHDLAHEKPDLVYPAESTRYDTTGWATINLP